MFEFFIDFIYQDNINMIKYTKNKGREKINVKFCLSFLREYRSTLYFIINVLCKK